MGVPVSRVIAVPNWTFASPELTPSIRTALLKRDLRVHYVGGDQDHGRTVTGFSGTLENVIQGMKDLVELLLPNIDLSLTKGAHPHSGALDVAPFIALEPSPTLIEEVRQWGAWLSERGIPIYFYEQAALSGRESSLPVLRGQIGFRPDDFDLGTFTHPQWGYSIVGVRDFLLAVNINLTDHSPGLAKYIAKELRKEREEGDPTLKGVRALGIDLASRETSQVSINMTCPDETSFDEVFMRVQRLAMEHQNGILETELIGVIRKSDQAKANYLRIHADQIVD